MPERRPGGGLGGFGPLVRIALAMIPAALVTFGLLVLMERLIAMGGGNLDEEKTQRVAEFIRMKKDSRLETKKRELPQKKKIEKQPKAPQMDLPTNTANPNMNAFAVAPPKAPAVDDSIKLNPRGISRGGGDSGPVPMVRIQPMYPREAQMRNLEGWVLMEFTINKAGGVSNPRVIKASPPNVFDRAALQALKKWKYKPKVEGGEPQEQTGVQVKLTFEMNQ